MKTDELAEHLNSLKREECYRIDAVLKESPFETTQRVMFIGVNGAEQGPYIRKYIKRDAGIGSAYARIFEAQQGGKRFRFIPRIVDCYDFDDMHVVVMEYVRGETLAEVVYRCDPSMSLAADVFCRLCDAASELHEEFDPPIIHRDLKPSNIILSRDNLTIIDFGIARAFREDADVDTVRFGTRAYAPPEQFGYHQTDVRSDVYALGMPLYYCLTEKTPDAHVRETGFADASIPASVRGVLLQATAFDPENRYTSARELKQAFLEAVNSEDVLLPFTFPKSDKSKEKPLKHQEAETTEVKQISSPHKSGESRKEQTSHILQKSMRRLGLIAVPLWLGVVWDVLLVLLLAMFSVIGIDQLIFNPTGEYATYPLWYNTIVCVGIMLIFAGSIFALLDKRLIARAIPAMRKVQGIKGAFAGIAFSLAIFVLIVIVCAIALLAINPTL